MMLLAVGDVPMLRSSRAMSEVTVPAVGGIFFEEPVTGVPGARFKPVGGEGRMLSKKRNLNTLC